MPATERPLPSASLFELYCSARRLPPAVPFNVMRLVSGLLAVRSSCVLFSLRYSLKKLNAPEYDGSALFRFPSAEALVDVAAIDVRARAQRGASANR